MKTYAGASKSIWNVMVFFLLISACICTPGLAQVSTPTGYFRVCSESNAWCLTPSQDTLTLTNGAHNPYTTQQLWTWAYIGRSGGNDYYQMKNYVTGLCVQPPDSNPYGDGAQLVTRPCCPQCTGQWWRQQDSGVFPGTWNLRNLPSGKCMDVPIVPGTMNWTGGPMQQWSCGTRNNQLWIITNS